MTATAVTKRELFERQALPHLDSLYRVAHHLTQDAMLAEDLVQETMLKAYRAWHQFQPDTNVRAWLFTILRHAFIDQYQKARRAGVQLDVMEIESFTAFDEVRQADPEKEFFNQLIDEDVIRAIDDLPDSFRETLILKDVEDLPYSAIGQILGVPLGTVKSRLFRARHELQQKLYEYAVGMGYIHPSTGIENGPSVSV